MQDEVAAFRLASWDTPFWVNPNRSAGRYNRPATAPTQYLCLHPLGPWAEYVRRENIREVDELLELRLRVWAVRLPVRPPKDVFELTFEAAKSIGLSADDLVADDPSACQEVAERLRLDPSFPKIWSVPSAALPGTQNVVIFGPRVALPYQARIFDDDLDVPCSVIADASPPPTAVLSLVRYYGDPHGELESWKAETPFHFTEPAFPALTMAPKPQP